MTPRDKARQGLGFIEEAVLQLLAEHPSGLRNADIAAELELRSDHQGSQRNYLSYSILGLLLNDGKVIKKGRVYTLASPLNHDQAGGVELPQTKARPSTLPRLLGLLKDVGNPEQDYVEYLEHKYG
ncbi:MAG TPA: hypothetical protein VG013_21825 [Gemmataceae bacterium]|nr:hypothetical protein [Gemmataceae bacterium]